MRRRSFWLGPLDTLICLYYSSTTHHLHSLPLLEFRVSYRNYPDTPSLEEIKRDRHAATRNVPLSELTLRSLFVLGSRSDASSCQPELETHSIADLRKSYAAYRSAESRLLLRLCLVCAYFVALRGPRWLAQSQRDYASALLGVPHSTFLRWVRVGRLLIARPQLRTPFRDGRLRLHALDERARRGIDEHRSSGPHDDSASRRALDGREGREEDRMGTNSELRTTGKVAAAGAGEPSRGIASDEFLDLSFSAPAPAILYLEDTMVLARAMVGQSQGDEEAVIALLAEAGSEAIRGAVPQLDAARARRRFGIKSESTRAETKSVASGCLSGGRALPHPTLPALAEHAQRRYAFRVHALLRRLMERRTRLRTRQEDQLYRWMLDGVHERCGYRNFESFARDILDLPRSSCNDRLRRARERRRNHPISLARARNEISIVQADLLARLHRRCHVPVSDLERWIRFAVHHTVRALRAAIDWARRQLLTDYRPWSLGGCRPPQADQLRTVNHSLEKLVKNPAGDAISEALLEWNDAPRGTVRFRLSRETRDELLVQLAFEQDQVQAQAETPAPRKIPAWLALCRVFHRARRVWAEHHIALPAAQRRILDRDGWRCAAPECTQRRNLQIHHLQYRAQGGDDRDSNRVTLCAFHHQIGEHQGLMRVRGAVQTDGTGLTWEMGLDEYRRPLMVYRDGTLLAPV